MSVQEKHYEVAFCEGQVYIENYSFSVCFAITRKPDLKNR